MTPLHYIIVDWGAPRNVGSQPSLYIRSKDQLYKLAEKN
jgi:hypothetical protein